ncbi:MULTISPECIES: hypothetical protein [unclassified Lysinibacillus]|uniref:hypothetical protein n=1 Tax=unclassified Lysinibacillus TaxID=2636778 RepID=UPI002556B162|nr:MULTISPECIES: hypothetical protein [unclassified Lysinibacillus]MDM5248266.1 hypothetical protein [Lysinibacillus sp. G4S2]
MKNFRPIIALMLLLSFVTACNQQKVDKDEFVVFAHQENMNDELRESLFICLNTEEIIYQVDNDNNVLIKNKDVDHAVTRCS